MALKTDPNTGRAIIHVAVTGKNSIILSSGANCEFSIAKIDYLFDFFTKCDHLKLQNEFIPLVVFGESLIPKKWISGLILLLTIG